MVTNLYCSNQKRPPASPPTWRSSCAWSTRPRLGSTMAIDFGTLILNETPDAVIVTTPDGAVVCWSRGEQAMFGYSEREALGATLAQMIVPSEFSDDERAVLRRTLERGQADCESIRRAKD